MADDLTIREKLDLAYTQLFGPEHRLGKMTFEWPDKGPMSFVTAGRPIMIGPFTIVIVLLVFIMGVEIVNWDANMRLAADPYYAAFIDWNLINGLNSIVPYATFFALLVAGYMGFYLHLNTWGNFLYQVEPAVVETLSGDLKQPVLRIERDGQEEVWPPKKGSEFEDWIAELEEELLAENLEWDQVDQLPSLKEAAEHDGRENGRKGTESKTKKKKA